MREEANIRSMTGFGRSSIKNEGCSCFVEIKSVNHRYLEINTKIPDEILSLDLEIKKIVKSYLHRGAVYLSLNLVYDGGIDLEINNELFRKLLKLEKQIEERHGISQPLNIHYILSYPGVVKQVFPRIPFKVKRELVFLAVRSALEALVESRVREGRHLKRDIEYRLEKIEKDISVVSILEEEKEKDLLRKMHEDFQKKEELQQVTRTSIVSTAEEIVRLKSHLKAGKALLNRGGMIGRELDFFAQEMNREINTLSAKALSARTSKFVVKIKAEIEKIREQALNIE